MNSSDEKSRISRKIWVVLVIALALFVSTTYVPRNGDYVINAAQYGDPSHRDVRGIPLVFLKRSLADGECDIHDAQIGTCNPSVGNEPHQISGVYAIIDIFFWFVVASAAVLSVKFAGKIIHGFQATGR